MFCFMEDSSQSNKDVFSNKNVIFSFQAILHSRTSSPVGSIFIDIKGIWAFYLKGISDTDFNR